MNNTIDLVATTKFPPEYFVRSHQLKFASGHDDLDALIFTHLNLPSGNTISLVRHQNAPYQGTEIYLAPGLFDPSKVLGLKHFICLTFAPTILTGFILKPI